MKYYTCGVCGGTVKEDWRPRHTQWHLYSVNDANATYVEAKEW